MSFKKMEISRNRVRPWEQTYALPEKALLNRLFSCSSRWDMLVLLLKYLLQQHFGDLWCQCKVFLVTTDVKVSCNVGCTECCFSAMKKSVIRSGIVQLNGSVKGIPYNYSPPKTNSSPLSPTLGLRRSTFLLKWSLLRVDIPYFLEVKQLAPEKMPSAPKGK